MAKTEDDKRIGVEVDAKDAPKLVKLKRGEETIEVPEVDAKFMLDNGWTK